MADESKSGSNKVVAVAVIGAVATLGAAFLANINKFKDAPAAKDPPATIQQVASGAGAINVGRDAVINNVKSAGEEAAELVQACEQRHGMKEASEKVNSTETIAATTYDPAQEIEHTDFRSCTWPKTIFADGDGYLQISVRTVQGPGQYEATGMTDADRFKAPCQKLAVGYGLGTQGVFESEQPFTIHADTVVLQETKGPWKNDGSLPFYPDAGEFVVLHNSHYALQTARCLD